MVAVAEKPHDTKQVHARAETSGSAPGAVGRGSRSTWRPAARSLSPSSGLLDCAISCSDRP